MNYILHGSSFEIAGTLLSLADAAENYSKRPIGDHDALDALRKEIDAARRLVVKTDERSQPI